MIEGVEIKRLVTNADERGSLTELIRRDDPIFEQFGQCYVSLLIGPTSGRDRADA